MVDVALVGLLGAASILAANARRKWVVTAVVGFLLVVGMYCCFSLEVFEPRIVIGQRTREGRWTQDYRDGVADAFDATFPYLLVIGVCGIGLAVLALRSNYRAEPSLARDARKDARA